MKNLISRSALMMMLAVQGLAVCAVSHAEQALVSDTELATNVKAALDSDSELQKLGLTVSSKKGEVTIEGTMTDDQQMAKAGMIAEKVSGVVFVNNKMELKN